MKFLWIFVLFALAGCKHEVPPVKAAPVVAPVRIAVSPGGYAGSLDVPFDKTFDRVEAKIKGFDWQEVGSVEASVVDGKVVLELPESLPDADLCKVARDDYKDYEGWWPATGVSDRAAKVAGLDDILAYRGNVCVGRLFLSDGDGGFVYFHYADRPFTLSGTNLTNPNERSTFIYQASFESGWTPYINLYDTDQYPSMTLTTTNLPASSDLHWQFERR